MKYLSFLTRLKKARYFFLVVVIMLAFTNNTFAKWSVYCADLRGGWQCVAINAACGEYRFPFSNSTCKDLNLASYKQGSFSLNRENGGLASFTIDGKRIQIASDAVSERLRSQKESFTSQKEFEAFLKADRGFVSDNRLDQISKELKIEVTSVNDAPSFANVKIELVSKEGKNTLTAMTDGVGKFSFSVIPDGTYEVRISKRTGQMPPVGKMTINGFGHIVCCCPGPPCEEPFWLIVGENPSAVRGALLLTKARQYVGTVTLVK